MNTLTHVRAFKALLNVPAYGCVFSTCIPLWTMYKYSHNAPKPSIYAHQKGLYVNGCMIKTMVA